MAAIEDKGAQGYSCDMCKKEFEWAEPVMPGIEWEIDFEGDGDSFWKHYKYTCVASTEGSESRFSGDKKVKQVELCPVCIEKVFEFLENSGVKAVTRDIIIQYSSGPPAVRIKVDRSTGCWECVLCSQELDQYGHLDGPFTCAATDTICLIPPQDVFPNNFDCPLKGGQVVTVAFDLVGK